MKGDSRPRQPRVLLVTGTCGSGKSTVASLLASREGWIRLSEDELWLELFGTNRGAFGSAEHRAKRHAVQVRVLDQVRTALHAGQSVAIDVTLHEAPPEAFEAYRLFFDHQQIPWAVRVLHPSLSVAVARDAARGKRPIGLERIADLRAKFTEKVFDPEWFLDTSSDTPAATVERLVRSGVA